MFEALEEWANQKSIHRLELTVITYNTAGIALYKKMGFEIEGKKRIHYKLMENILMSIICRNSYNLIN